MIIKRYSNQLGGFLPEAVVTLSSDLSMPLYHATHQHKIRHPLGAYNISIQSILANFKLVLGEIGKITEGVAKRQILLDQLCSTLPDAQKNLLRSLDEHFDDCEKILRAFFPPNDQSERKRHITQFKDDVSQYSEHVRKIVNHLKHSQGRIQTALVIPASSGIVIPTYYIEGVDDAGHLGPDPKIHPEPNTSFSFCRDLRYHLCTLYIVSHHLSEAIKKIAGTNITPATSINGTDREISEIASLVSHLPKIWLPNEHKLDVPTVEVIATNDASYLSIEFPSQPLPGVDLGRSWVVSGFIGDGVTKSFRLPFTPAVSTD